MSYMKKTICSLGRVEVQLCMQMLDAKSIVALATCNKQLFADANNAFAFKFVAVLRIREDETKYENSLLRFHMNRMTTDFEIFLRKKSHITYLSLWLLRHDDMTQITNTLQSNQTLVRLDITSVIFYDAGVDSLAHMLSENKTLQTFLVRSTSLSDDQIKSLCAALQKNTTLTSLQMSNVGMSTRGATHVANMLLTNKKLTQLNLDCNYMGDEGLFQIANALHENATVQSLVINDNKITDAGVRHLAHALTLNKSVQILALCDNNITGISLLSLAQACATINTTLKWIDLKWSNFQMTDIMSFVKISKSFKTNVQFIVHRRKRFTKIDSMLRNMNECKHIVQG